MGIKLTVLKLKIRSNSCQNDVVWAVKHHDNILVIMCQEYTQIFFTQMKKKDTLPALGAVHKLSNAIMEGWGLLLVLCQGMEAIQREGRGSINP